MAVTKLPVIKSVERVENNILMLSFEQPWQLDHIEPIVDHCIQLLDQAVIKETLRGADLYAVRIALANKQYLLNFEEYSHSCWLECVTDEDIDGLEAIARALAVR